jgi:hypothetical protein
MKNQTDDYKSRQWCGFHEKNSKFKTDGAFGHFNGVRNDVLVI